MVDLLIVVVPLAVVALLLWAALRYLVRTWVDYRVRIAVLESMDRRSDLLTEPGGAGGTAVTGNPGSAGGTAGADQPCASARANHLGANDPIPF